MSQRNNVVEQIGLRGSHFTLGNNNPNPFQPISKTSYNNKEKPRQMPNIKESNIADAVAHDKANLRASHFSLGNQDPKQYFYTTNSRNLKHHQEFDKAVLSEEQRKELRSHHFQMGQYAPTTQTINNLTYDRKPLIEMKDQDRLKRFMTGHHHDFREMRNTVMTTKYNDDYNQAIDKQALYQGQTPEQMREKALALRHSHIILGKEQPHFQSVQQQDFTKKENIYKPQSKDLQSSHFQLGVQKDPMCTTNDVFHTQQPIIPNPLAEETKNDLRSSHFNMGQDKLSYQSEFSGNYNQVQQDNRLEQKISTAQLQANHFSLGDPTKASNYQTSYSSQMKKPNLESTSQARDQKADRSSNFIIGNQGNSYTSEFNANYKQTNGQPSVLNAEKKADLRSSHFKFDSVKQNNYQTNYSTKFSNRDAKNAMGQMDEALLKDLRSNHFNFGTQQGEYSTTQREFHKHPGNPRPPLLNEAQRANLRAHHFKLG